MTGLIRHPIRTAILVGIAFTVIFGVVSFPSEGAIDKTIEDWLPQNNTNDQQTIDDLIQSLENERATGGQNLVTLSEDEFRDRRLALALASLDDTGDHFVIRYLGKETEDSQTIYLAERKVAPAPWWSPDRLIYQAAEGKVDRLGSVLTLTFERDLTGLLGLLLIDLTVGAIYGGIVGLILWTLGLRHLEPPAGPGRGAEVPVGPSGPIPGPGGYALEAAKLNLTHKRLPPEQPLTALGKGQDVG